MTTASPTPAPADPAQLPQQAVEVLQFWFDAVPLNNEAALGKRGLWFIKSDVLDADIARRFGPLVRAAKAGELDAWAQTPEGCLALIVVLDQFTRNTARGRAEAFAGDARALALARQAMAQGLDAHVPLVPRIFFYLPLEHAEDMACQEASVAAYAQLLAQAEAAQAGHAVRELLANTHDFALRHQAVIAEFGRFPHRNAQLGRTSTAAEQAYLAQPGAGF